MNKLGLVIYDEYKISLGDTVAELRQFIQDYGIKYHSQVDICNSALNSENMMDVIVLIMLKTSGVEVRLDKGFITYIKAYNSDLNFIMTMDDTDTNPIELINKVKHSLAEKIGTEDSNIRIKTFDLDKLYFTFETKFKGDVNIMVSVTTTANKSMYIETIQYIK